MLIASVMLADRSRRIIQGYLMYVFMSQMINHPINRLSFAYGAKSFELFESESFTIKMENASCPMVLPRSTSFYDEISTNTS